MAVCPCGSGLGFAKCCQPYISGASQAPTAEALMRARYSAYATGNTEFIDATVHPDKRDAADDTMPDENITWLGLSILGSRDGKQDDDSGEVEFEARFEVKGKRNALRERSEFRNQDGQWYYYDGTMLEDKQAPVRSNKIGRNEPCPCGSGRKYKKCCGS